MKFIFIIISILVIVVATFSKESPHFNINTSGPLINHVTNIPLRQEIKRSLPTKIHSVDLKAIPESFDAREAWPQCASVIGDIKDQGGCAAGWAFAAIGTINDRICIHSNATIQMNISALDLLTCCSDCNYGCTGGRPVEGWYYWSSTGVVTGGKYGTNDGCKAYSIEPCDHYVDGSCEFMGYAPDCVKACDEGSSLEYDSDLKTGAPYYVVQTEAQIQTEIMTNGPVAASFDMYQNLLSYKSGVYQQVTGWIVRREAAKLIGWGVEEGVPYWLAANSLNDNWGENGYFKILRGSNFCDIESEPLAGIPKL
ncbi:hypothetical protein Zmor_007234 [Zophobas morio]|uniref:Peptidase C1A papain C-terminal domain-containing protein n=1 Tax=Zophobas morio TaxID=2755281 RepID=A0AA38MP70_9CUCU|nr:hypothetical protein Zmor_007234 [Zophobas morio]